MKTTPSPSEIRERLERILPLVEKPARYLGLERNLIRKPWESVPLHVALAFPDTYEIGMSHQGSRILYHVINRRSDALAERTFAPWPDMGARLEAEGVPLYTLESYRAARSFDVVGMTLQSELNYINIPYVLDLSGIPTLAADRCENDPIVLGGGPCTANPEPVADFFDALFIVDAEAGLDDLLDTIKKSRAAGLSRLDVLRSMARLPGIYVPSLYRWAPEAVGGGRWEPFDDGVPFPVQRVWAPELDPADQPETPIVPFAEVVQGRLGMEIMRGCTRGCRFCQAGFWYRPVREHDPAVVTERMERQVAETGLPQVGLLSLSSADYSQIEPLATELASRLTSRRASVSLPSLRADAFSVGLAEAVSSVRKSGFTFAPETGSDRLRRVINKTLTNDQMVEAAEAAFAAGWNLIKVYAMIGLPTETDEDLEALAELTRRLVSAGRRIRGGKASIKVSVGCFVPKAWTPFQWEPFAGVQELERRIRLLRDLFRPIRGVRLTWNEPFEAALEAVLSRGDRRLAGTILAARRHGAHFDGWTDLLDLSAWQRALAETGIDTARELNGREISSTLPWDVIDPGIRKGFLRAELRRALAETTTEDCKWGSCFHCGLPGDGEDIRLAPSSLPPVAPSNTPGTADKTERRDQPGPTAVSGPIRQQPVHRKVRFTFSKTGDARFLSHRLTMDALERAVRGSSLPVRFTEGFNPHVKLSMGPALPLGYEGLAETFDVDCTGPIRSGHVAALNQLLPDGLEILDARELLQGAPSLGKLTASARYRVTPPNGWNWTPEVPPNLPPEIADGVLGWSLLPNGVLRVELNLRPKAGPTPGPKKLLAALGIDEKELPLVRVVREIVVLRTLAQSRSREEPA